MEASASAVADEAISLTWPRSPRERELHPMERERVGAGVYGRVVTDKSDDAARGTGRLQRLSPYIFTEHDVWESYRHRHLR